MKFTPNWYEAFEMSSGIQPGSENSHDSPMSPWPAGVARSRWRRSLASKMPWQGTAAAQAWGLLFAGASWKKEAEVVVDREPALEELCPERLRLFFGRQAEDGIRDVQQGIAEQLRIGQAEDVAAAQGRIDERDLVHDLHEVALGARVVVRPGRLAV